MSEAEDMEVGKEGIVIGIDELDLPGCMRVASADVEGSGRRSSMAMVASASYDPARATDGAATEGAAETQEAAAKGFTIKVIGLILGERD